MTRILRICPYPFAITRRYTASSGGRLHRRDIGRRHRFVPGVFLLRLLDPGGEGLLAHHADRDRHEGVILAAQLRALAVIDSLPGCLEPGLVDAPWNGVDLDAERRHGERMDDIGAGGDQG